MLAVGLCIALFAFWGAVGYAVAVALSAERNRLQSLLLGPALGVALTVIPLFILSRFGVPVRAMALGIFSALTLLTVLLLVVKRPALSWKQVAPFGGVLALALVLTGRPMFEFGLHWMSYCNDDMANYCLSARWLKDHGVNDAPTPEEITSGTDYTKVYWMLHVPAMSRVGCELIVSWVSTLSGINEHQAFNPIIMAFHLALIAAVGGLVLRRPEDAAAAVTACLLVSLSALNSLGTLVQVIAQVGGLALLATCAALVFRPFDGLSRSQLLRHGVLVGVIGAAQAILYAEVLPFLFLAFCLYTLVQVVRGRRPWGMLGAVGFGALVGIVLLRKHALTVITYIVVQSAGGSLGDDPLKSLMPYFLVPAGLANLWGFQHITVLSADPWLSYTIAAGALLLVAAAAAAVWQTWRGEGIAAFAVVMLLVGPYLFVQRTGFGTFKLAMFVQPFMLGTIVVAWFAMVRNPVARYVPLALLGLSGVFVQQWYVQESRGANGTFSLIPFATPSRADAEFQRLAAQHKGATLIADPYNVVLAKFQSLHAQGSPIIFPGGDFFRTVMTYKEHVSTAGEANLRRAKEITLAEDAAFPDAVFNLQIPDSPDAVNKFHTCRVGGYDGTGGPGALLVASSGIQGIYNRRHLPAPANFRAARNWKNFAVIPYADARNHLIAVASDLSQPFYSSDPSRIGAYQVEPEPIYFRGGTMAALGRYLMFQVVNPTPGARLAINVTGTYLADGQNRLPQPQVIGTQRWSLGAAGRGSARLFSPPLAPQRIDGRDYLMVDMGRAGERFKTIRGGLMNLYGRDVALDRRVLVGFARDVSLISDEQFQKLAPPASLERFPSDLAHPDLEYSGIYEDGWCSEVAFAYLGQGTATAAAANGAGATGGGPKAVLVRGTVPAISGDNTFRAELRVLVDGKELGRQVLAPGDFEFRGGIEAASTGAARRRVELRFSDVQRLPDGDRRPVAALLRYVGLVDATPADQGFARQ